MVYLLKQKKIYLFIGCTWSPMQRMDSNCGEQGLLLIAVCRLLVVVASLSVEHRIWAHKLQQLYHERSLVVPHRLSPSVVCVIFPDHGLNQCPLHCKAHS